MSTPFAKILSDHQRMATFVTPKRVAAPSGLLLLALLSVAFDGRE